MWFWLTVDGDVRCEHPVGRVGLVAPEALVFVQGRRLLTGSDPERRPISGCSNVGVGIKPCTTTVRPARGRSAWVTIEGRPVIRADLEGLTDGTPQGGVAYRVQHPGQTLVTEAP